MEAEYKAIEVPGTFEFKGKPHRLLTLTSPDSERLAVLADLARRKGWLDYAEGTDTATGAWSIWMLKPTY